MNVFELMTKARDEAGWNEDSSLFVALDFIEGLVKRGIINSNDFEVHLEAQISFEIASGDDEKDL